MIAVLADVIVLLAQSFVTQQFSAWFYAPLSFGHALWLVAVLRLMNVARYRKGSLESWDQALGQTGVAGAIILLVAWAAKSIFVGDVS